MDTKLSRWCDGLIEAGWLVAVIATPLFFNIHSDRVFEPDKLTLLRSVAILMSVAWLVKFIDQKGWQSLSGLSWRDESSIWRLPFVLPVFLLVVVYAISTLTSVTPRVSWAGSYQRLQGTYTTFSYIVIFALTIATLRSRHQVRRIVTAVIITSIPISFYGLLQHFSLDPLPWGGDVTRRVAGHMGNAIFVAAYLIMAFPLTIARIVDAFTSILSEEELAQADVIRSSIYIFVAAIQLITIYWTQSRGPWIGLLIGIFAFILIVLVSLRSASDDKSRFRLVEGLRAIGLIIVGVGVLFFIFRALINAITGSGRILSLVGPMSSFVAFALAVGVIILVIFVMIAARKGWRWLWLGWLSLAVLVAVWLAMFNFADRLQERYPDTPLIGPISAELALWQDLPSIGRLGQLFDAQSVTGRVRVLIWEGALDLLDIHEPLSFPDGESDKFNFLRPLFGYGPESMYVAYNRFYPPELATVEARNASPDRSHNETFDALVITGVTGFLVWQALYLSVFYYGFRWLGVIRTRFDSVLLIGLWIGGALLAGLIIALIMGAPFLGVGVPLGSILGLVLYLFYHALFSGPDSAGDDTIDPFAVDRLLMAGLVTAIMAHYAEIHFGIAIAATRIHFFIYVALMFMVGYWLPKMKDTPAATVPERGRKKRIVRRARAGGPTGPWGAIWLSALMLALTIGILGYEYTTYSLPPDKEITSPADLTAGEIFRQSFLVNASDGFRDSPFIYLMVILTWSLGSLLIISEMVKSKELKPPSVSVPLPPRLKYEASFAFMVMAAGSLFLRFIAPAPEDPGSSALLGRTLLLIWAALTIWTIVRLASDSAGSRLMAVAVALVGLLFALPVLFAGGGAVVLVMGLISLFVAIRLWHKSFSAFLLPGALLAFVSLLVGLAYAYVQASTLRSSLFFSSAQQPSTTAGLRLLEAQQSSSFLILFYLFVVTILVAGAFAASWKAAAKLRVSGSGAAYASLPVLFIVAMVAVNQSNMRIIQADVIYKRAKPFDTAAGRSRNSEDWDTAIAIYEHAVDLVPSEDFYYLFLGRAYLEQSTVTPDPVAQASLLTRAEERLINAQRINPLNTDHTANLARLNTRWTQLSDTDLERDQRLEAAEGYYLDALDLSPQNSIIRNEYGRLAFDLKRDCDKAIEVYDTSAAVDPYFDNTFFGRAEILISCAQDAPLEEKRAYLGKAIDSLNGGLELNDRNFRVWIQLAQAYQEVGAYEKAAVSFEEARSRTRGEIPDWNIDYWLSALYLQAGDPEAAERQATEALVTAPPDAVGQFQAILGQIDGALERAGLAGAPPPGRGPLTAIPPADRNGIFAEPPPVEIDPSKPYEALVTTERGDMRFRLFPDRAPLTVNNFVFLSRQGFYDDTIFHRVLEGFMAQGGDPTGTGTGGPGYRFPDEFDPSLTFDRRGLLAMANSGPNTNGSQFFITFVPTPHLNNLHTIFGELIAGDEVLASLALRDPNNPSGPGDRILGVQIFEGS
jgi:cyclophilin family peptidyl-prolyl cis-trans isomerase/tetratricopeptide (TPR) repeat protein/O-antigen ligase